MLVKQSKTTWPQTQPLEAPAPDPSFVPSSYQQAIFDWVTNGRGDAFVEAVAGSGKTTTITQAATLTRSDRVLFLAFNRHIVAELKGRLPAKTDVKTINAVGMQTVRRAIGDCEVQAHKYSDLARSYLQSQHLDDQDGEIRRQLTTLVGFVQSSLVESTDRLAMLELIEHFGLELDDLELCLAAAPKLLEEGVRLAVDHRVISFSDQLWLPHVMNLQPFRYDWVFVDESQDLSPAQRELVLKCRGRGGRMLFVGDERQAIYGFAGADSASVQAIIERTGAQRFPLSICYRCPKSHVELAKRIVPQIEATPTACEGTVQTIAAGALADLIQEGDLILCRVNAPLVELTFRLIAKGVPARMRGRDIGQGLVAVLKKVEKRRGFDIDDTLEHLTDYQRQAIDELRAKDGSEMQIDRVVDQVASLKVIYQSAKPTSMWTFKETVLGLFSDDRPGVMLSSVHRAKGLEERRVFILKPDLMPHPMARKAWETTQEQNLRYVALTRAKEALFFVADEPKREVK